MPALIEAEDLRKVFESDDDEKSVVALDSVSLTVRQGELIAILGPSGCGKSTLLSIIAGLSSPSSGEIRVEGQPPKPGRDIGVMFQRSLLFPWRTALQNVMLPAEIMRVDRDAARSRALELLELVGLDGWGHSYPGELSGGMQQRVALSRVLLPDPALLLLDEPFGALDEMTRENLDLEIQRIATLTGKTVVLVTHSLYEAVLVADRIVVLSARPARIAGVIDVPLERPRSLENSGTPEFAETVRRVREVLAEGDH